MEAMVLQESVSTGTVFKQIITIHFFGIIFFAVIFLFGENF
jgi:hypothetical protein